MTTPPLQSLSFRTPLSPTKPKHDQRTGVFKSIIERLEELKEGYFDYKKSLKLYKAQAAFVAGKEKHSGLPVTALYFGHGLHCKYILDQLYDNYDLTEIGQDLRMWQAKSWTENHGDVDLVVLDIPWPYEMLLPKNRYLEIPAWVVQRLDIEETWEKLMGRFSKSARNTYLRKIRKYNVGYRLTKQQSAVEAFYHQMYRPYLEKRFGDIAEIASLEKIQHYVKYGNLLEVTREERVVAAAVLFEWKGCLRFLWTGGTEDLRDPAASGDFSALYYYSILHAFEQGCDTIELGGTRPFINDGIFQVKRRWGASVLDDWTLDTLLIQPKRFTPGVLSFFSHHPMIARRDEHLVGKILFEKNRLTPEDLSEFISRYVTDGLSCLEIYCTFGITDEAHLLAESAPHSLKLFNLNPAEMNSPNIFVS